MDETSERRQRIGDAVVTRRVELGLSRKEVAERSGLSYPYLAQIENGDREPSLKSLYALASALEMPVEELTGSGSSVDAFESAASPAPVAAAISPAPASRARSAGASSGFMANPAHEAPASPPSRTSASTQVRRLLRQISPEERVRLLSELQAEALIEIARGSASP